MGWNRRVAERNANAVWGCQPCRPTQQGTASVSGSQVTDEVYGQFSDYTFVGHEYGFWPDFGLRNWEVMEHSRTPLVDAVWRYQFPVILDLFELKARTVPLPPRSYSMAFSVGPNPRGKLRVGLGQTGLVAVYPRKVIRDRAVSSKIYDSMEFITTLWCFFLGNQWIFRWQMFIAA